MCEFFFDSRVRKRQKIFDGWPDSERSSVRSPDRVKYYCDFPSWWMPYEPRTLLFEPSHFVLEYYSVIAIRGSAEDQTKILTIALFGYNSILGRCS